MQLISQDKNLITLKHVEDRDAIFFDSEGKPEVKVGGSRGKPKAETFMGAAKLQRKIDLETDKHRGGTPEVVGSVCVFENGKKCWRAAYDLRNHKGRGREVVILKGGALAVADSEKDTDILKKPDGKLLSEMKAEYAKANAADVIKKWAFPLKPKA